MGNQQASILNIEKHVGQLAQLMHERLPGTLLRNTKINPRAHVLPITTQGYEELEPLVLIYTTLTCDDQRLEEEIMKVEE